MLHLWFLTMLKAQPDIHPFTGAIPNPLFMFHLIRQERVTLFVWSGDGQFDPFQAA